MKQDKLIPEPFLFNPMKHHLAHIRSFAELNQDAAGIDLNDFVGEIKQIGASVTDIYTGKLTIQNLCSETESWLSLKGIRGKDKFSQWSGTGHGDYRLVTLSDNSEWMLKYHNDNKRYIHFFPARSGPFSLRVKANTLKSALLYYVLIGKDYITRDDLNRARSHISLSPVRTTTDADAIIDMIEILRSGQG